MGQTACCQADVESIMRRLRGSQTPYTPPAAPMPTVSPSSEVAELKTIVKTMGARLKEAYQELTDAKEALLTSEQSQQRSQEAVTQLQASLTSKEQELASAGSRLAQTSLLLEKADHDLAALRSTKSAAPSPDLALLREELLALRSEQLSWQEERKRLEAVLEHERQRGRSDTSNTNGQLVRLAMSCKQLEEEVHSLQCERAATLRQFNQIKELLDDSDKALAGEREKRQEREEALAASTKTIQELIDALEKSKTTVASLTEGKEAAQQLEAALRSQIAIETANLAQEKAGCEALATSLKAANDSFRALTSQLEQERRLFHETEERCMLSQKEKEAAEIRVKEVEELLIVKLQMISDLEERLGEALASCEDHEHRALTAEQHGETLAADLQKMTQARDALHEKTLAQEQQIGRLGAEQAELKKRTEAFERLKKSSADAVQHAHAIIRSFDTGPRPPLTIGAVSDDMASSAPSQERTLFEERFEQHELF